jgi:pyruvate/2-oxoglutarate dehydrogenase complex dihydrolipoamide acyltransferase (E2) component
MAAPLPARIENYTKLRRIMELTLRAAARVPVVHGLVEFDVTRPRTAIAAHRERTGQSLSFTAFIVGCVAQAVCRHPQVHALRQGRTRMVIYDDVDIGVMVERDVDGVRHPIIAVLRAANRRSLEEIHADIRNAQHGAVEETWTALASFRYVPYLVFRLIWPVLWWMIRRRPDLQRHFRGTVGVSAFGMFGNGAGWGIPITNITSISVGGIATRPAFVDGKVLPREMLSVTISVDHAMIDGAATARFVATLRELVESGHGLPVGDLAPRAA